MPLVTLLGLAMVLAWAAAAPCPKGLSFWDTDQQQCNQCSACVVNEVVLLPCQPYKDTVCGPISALNINWAWLQPPPAQIRAPSTPRPLKKVRTGARRVSLVPPLLPTPPPASAPTTVGGHSSEATEVAVTETEATSTTVAARVWTQSSSEAPTTKVSAQPFLAHETSSLVEWDWQALALAATIASFVVLLVVFAVYAAVHARRATLRRRSLQQGRNSILRLKFSFVQHFKLIYLSYCTRVKCQCSWSLINYILEEFYDDYYNRGTLARC